jgi:hypothetical protein
MSRSNLGLRWTDYDEDGNQIPNAPIGRTMSNQPVRHIPELQTVRDRVKSRNKNALVLDGRQLPPSVPIFNGERIDSDVTWPSTEEEYFQTPDESRMARNAKIYERTKDPQEKWRYENAMGDEPDPNFDERRKYKLTGISEDGKTGTLCDLTTGQCIMIAIAATIGLAYLTSGGASKKRLKTRAKKTHRKK